jgi:penicillin-binding protein 2
MWGKKMRTIRLSKSEISPDEILIDAHNLPSFETSRLDGRLNKPIDTRALSILLVVIVLVGALVIGRSVQLMVVEGASYVALSEKNRLGQTIIFPERGIIYDRNGIELAWNTPQTDSADAHVFNNRAYGTTTGSGHLIGYVRMPERDTKGFFYREAIEGVAGVEATYNKQLEGEPGTRIMETDAQMHTVGEAYQKSALSGKPLTLTVDSRLQKALYQAIEARAQEAPFKGGAGIVMDIENGEILAMTSYPEFDPKAFVEGDAKRLAQYNADERTPFLNRAVTGQYTPGSIVKPYMAVAALTEGIVRPETTFISTGALLLANPYSPGQSSSFTDWKAHGAVDLRRALAVSSNVYFYYIGGGFGGQEGLGIERIERYMRLFGFGTPSGIELLGEASGVIPSPAWKKEVFPQDPTWRIGDTYHTSIGQYGFQVTPLQVARALSALANGGLLLTPRIETQYSQYTARNLDLKEKDLDLVRAGMRDAVLQGTAQGLNVGYVQVAGKTGTAEIGVGKNYVNSWVIGFYPYNKPKYAFVVLMEHGSRKNLVGATFVMRQFLDWVHVNIPEYLGTNDTE